MTDITPNPVGASPTREPLDERSADGLEVTDCTGVLIGNTDIPAPEYVPTVVTPGTTQTCVYPKQADMEPKP